MKSGDAEHIAIALLSSSDGENESLADRITKQNKRMNVEQLKERLDSKFPNTNKKTDMS